MSHLQIIILAFATVYLLNVAALQAKKLLNIKIVHFLKQSQKLNMSEPYNFLCQKNHGFCYLLY